VLGCQVFQDQESQLRCCISGGSLCTSNPQTELSSLQSSPASRRGRKHSPAHAATPQSRLPVVHSRTALFCTCIPMLLPCVSHETSVKFKFALEPHFVHAHHLTVRITLVVYARCVKNHLLHNRDTDPTPKHKRGKFTVRPENKVNGPPSSQDLVRH